MTIATLPGLVVVPNNQTPADRSIEKRRLRKHLLLNVIREKGPLSRADISKVSGYNLPNVSSLVDELVADGIVLEEEAKKVPRGRRPVPVYLNESFAAVVGIDIGKSSTISMILNLAGRMLSRFEIATPELPNAEAQRDWALLVADKLLEASKVSVPPLCGIGLALPGLIASGEESLSASLVGLVQGALGAKFGVPVIVQNDARMMALGCHWFGAGKRYSHFAVINVGQGIGLGVFIEGRIFAGKQGFGCELGYVPLGEQGVPGFHNRDSALENVASGAGIMRLAKRARLRARNVAELADQARGGNQKAVEVFHEFARALGRGMATVVNLFDPEALILSGRVTRAADLFLDEAKKELARHALEPILQNTEIFVSELDVDLGPLGAAASVLHQIFRTAHVQVDEVI